MPSQYQILPWSASVAYQQYDIANEGTQYFATQNVGPGAYSPSGVYTFTVTGYSRADDVVTLRYTHSGGPPFAPGSIVKVAGTTVGTLNYTGMVIGGGSGTLSYISAGGYPATLTALGAGTISCDSPAWTTGFYFVPDYSTKIPTQNDVIETKLGSNYGQRMSVGLNTFSQSPTFVYRQIDKRQMKAMVHFVETLAGVSPFEVLIPDPFISNQPNLKWTAQTVEVSPPSFERYDCTVQLTRVFDP